MAIKPVYKNMLRPEALNEAVQRVAQEGIPLILLQ